VVRKILKWLSHLVMGIVVLVIIISVYSIIQTKLHPGQVPSVLGYKSLSVLSGSMRPVFDPGDMIIIQEVKPESVVVGDILTFKVGSAIVTHRAVKVTNENGKIVFETKGDANNTNDGSLAQADQLIGRYVFRILYGGYIGVFARSRTGFILMILLPIGWLMAGEIRVIISELVRSKREKLKQKVMADRGTKTDIPS
jgi:signal peptidase I